MSSRSKEHIVADVACTVCGCVCDDLRLTISGDRVTRAEHACLLAEPFFVSLAKPSDRPVASFNGAPIEYESAIGHSVDLLRKSRATLVWGLSRSSTEAHRAAIRLAEQRRGYIDTAATVGQAAATLALQQVGESTCSLGEVKNRADLVIFWRADPATTHPRHMERYSADPRGQFLPGGRADRHVIVIDSRETATSRLADEFLRIEHGADAALIARLRQILAGGDVETTAVAGLPHDVVVSLANRLKGCRYGAIFFGIGTASSPTAQEDVVSLLSLVKELNAFTRFTARRMSSGGGTHGAESALTWITGFPFAVSFAEGYPKYSPAEYSANILLEKGVVDACLLVGSEAVSRLSEAAQQALKSIPTIALDYQTSIPTLSARVQFTTAIYGIHAAGTAYRMDDVPIPLRKHIHSEFPTDDRVLSTISERLGDA